MPARKLALLTVPIAVVALGVAAAWLFWPPPADTGRPGGGADIPAPGRPVWFAGGHGAGLTQSPDGSVLAGSERLELEPKPAPGSLHSAVYYPREGALVAVDRDARAVLYAAVGNAGSHRLRQRAEKSPPGESRTLAARFGRIPGLVYLTWSDLAVERKIEQQPAIQEYSDRGARLELSPDAKSWHAVPATDPGEVLLGALYRPCPEGIELFGIWPVDGRGTLVRLPEPAAEPFRSGPGDDLSQAVFIFPDRGIVTRTVRGWALNAPDGRLVKWFPMEDPGAIWWMDPVLREGAFLVRARTGPGGVDYRLDVESGKLVKVEPAGAAGGRPAGWAQPLELPGCPNLHRVSKDLYRGAQPTVEGFRELEKLGIRTVVNLRSFHTDSDELKAAGVKLRPEHIFMKAWHAEDHEVVRFLKIMAEKDSLPVFVHCQHGADRTGTMCAVYRMAVQGWTKQEALKEMTEGGYGFHGIWQNLLRYINGLDIEEMKRRAGEGSSSRQGAKPQS